jgi:hypothetical protein
MPADVKVDTPKDLDPKLTPYKPSERDATPKASHEQGADW